MTMAIDGTGGLTFPNNSTQTVGGIGAGSQTWQDFKSSRAINTTYTNSTGKPIMIAVTLVSNGSQFDALCEILVNGSTVYYNGPSSGATGIGSFYGGATTIVPNGATYYVSYGAYGFSISFWSELR
jgi:hypothetical protein